MVWLKEQFTLMNHKAAESDRKRRRLNNVNIDIDIKNMVKTNQE